MKKKSLVPIMIFLVHLLICLLLSFDYPFLQGMYMGFGLTFLVIWGLTLPVITACMSVIGVMIQIKKKEKFNLLKGLTAVVGCAILMIYLASASGLLKNYALNFFYIVVLVGTLFIWGCWGVNIKKSR